MKTSTKWLLAALLLLLGSLTAYNMTLRTEYARGTYKDPLRNTTALAFKNFDELDVPAAGLLHVKVVAGPYGVRLNRAVADYVQVHQQGRRLRVTLAFPEGFQYLGRREALIISLPRLRQLTAGSTYSERGKPATEKHGGQGELQIEGFRQDSLRLRQDLGARLTLAHNQLGYLEAAAGATPGSQGALQLNEGNHIAVANLDLGAQSELLLSNTAIGQLRHRFGDSTKVTLTGAALGSVLK